MSDQADELRGMILAAGYGTRLAPVTDHVPKPLLPVDGQTLLDRIIGGFDLVGIRDIGLNVHHLADQIAEHIDHRADSGRFDLFREEEILGTGGALHGARDFLSGSPAFLLYNGDVLCDADLAGLVMDHRRSGALATLLLVDWPAVNSVTLSEYGSISSIADLPRPNPDGRALTYAGIGVFARELLDDIGPGFSSLIDPLVRAIATDPGSVRGHVPENPGWSDLGTLARYLDAQSDVLPTTPTKRVAPGLILERITGHGSDRKFWRLGKDEWSAVAMVTPPEDAEFDRFVSVAGFLKHHDLGAPTLLSVAEDDHTLLMEDLGSDSLYSLVQAEGFESERVAELYRLAVDRLVELQAVSRTAMTECPLAVDRSLDYDGLRWETSYFQHRFLEGHLGLDPTGLDHLESEFHQLAEMVAASPGGLIHRDFQSQNILAVDGRIGLVDFQGMRLGPMGYDLASLIYDPYVRMPEHLRNDLVERFAAGGKSGVPPQEIRQMVQMAGLQRVMQALGAYGFLGQVRGKRGFLSHIPAAIAILKELLGETGNIPIGEASPDPARAHSFLPGLTILLDDY